MTDTGPNLRPPTSQVAAAEPRACICTADNVGCRENAQVNDVLCRSCRLHHERPFGPNMPRHSDQGDQFSDGLNGGAE